jgi:hypothetical protein
MEFQKKRKAYMQAVYSKDDWTGIRRIISTPEIYDLLNENAIELRKYAEDVYQCDMQGQLTNSVQSITMGLIHMFCNRLEGNSWERKLLALTRHGVQELQGYLKHQS